MHGWPISGTVEPFVECALIQAVAISPPASSAQIPSFATIQSLRQRVAQLAILEWVRWGEGTFKESEPAFLPVLEDYWCTGVHEVPVGTEWWRAQPWSAVFISWIIRQAGAGNDFAYSKAHTDYVGEAKKNRLANNDNPFKAYDIDEVAPRIGDLVCMERGDSGVTYENVDQGFRKSHCDIVTGITPRSLVTIGGNVCDSVWKTFVPINGSGLITKKGYYAVVQVGNSHDEQLTGGPGSLRTN